MDEFNLGLALIISLAVAAVGLALYGCHVVERKRFQVQGVVKNLTYVPDTNDSNLAPTFTGNGVGVTVVQTGSDEQFIVVVKTNAGELIKCEDEKAFAALKVGDEVTVMFETEVPRWGDPENKVVGLRW